MAGESAPAAELEACFEALVDRVARLPINQLVMHKLLVNRAGASQGLAATQALGTFFDGIARHIQEGFEFQRRAAAADFEQAVRERDEPSGTRGVGADRLTTDRPRSNDAGLPSRDGKRQDR